MKMYAIIADGEGICSFGGLLRRKFDHFLQDNSHLPDAVAINCIIIQK
jgi:hypothetical protein